MTRCTVSLDWTYKGMRVLTMENGALRVSCLLDKGSDLMVILYKSPYVDFPWHSPAGVSEQVHGVPRSSRNDGAFMAFDGGCRQDVLPNAGGPPANRGAKWGLHGEINLLPWDCDVVRARTDEVTVHLSIQCIRYPLRVDKWYTLRRGEARFTIRETVTNQSGRNPAVLLAPVPAYGDPLPRSGCTIGIPADTVVVAGPEAFAPCTRLPTGECLAQPRVRDRTGRTIDLSVIPSKAERSFDLAFLMDLRNGWYAITNPDLDPGFALRWADAVFPYVWYWQTIGATWDHPWFAAAWAIVLEPCTSWLGTGLADQIAHGTAVTFRGRQSLDVEFTAIAYGGRTRMTRVSPEDRATG